MVELAPRERLQPCLLDRLTDDDPFAKHESREARVMSMRQYRQAVLRDLLWLLNTASHRSRYDDLDDFPQVQKSVLNYGIPDFTGGTSATVDPFEMERIVLRAIQDFEPRILPQSMSIRAKVDPDVMGPTCLTFEIEGDLWSQPFPEALYIQTEMDLETGQCTVENRPNG